MQKLYAVRGATSAENTLESISENTILLYTNLLSENSLKESQLVSLHISITDDLTELNPATALRAQNYADELPLFCSQEPTYKHSKPHIIRFLLYFYERENYKPKSVYLHEAACLRRESIEHISIPLLSNGDKKISNTERTRKKLWLVTREYAGIAEAGGLKTVVKALAEGAQKQGAEVTVFLPAYSFIQQKTQKLFTTTVMANGQEYHIQFLNMQVGNTSFILIDTPLFSGKEGIYTYTEHEAVTQQKTKGQAYDDTNEMNIVFQLAIVEYASAIARTELADVIHCHDGQTAFLPALFAQKAHEKSEFSHIRFFITIHNAGDSYRQQLYDKEYAHRLTGLDYCVLENGMIEESIEPFLVSAHYAQLTTVSPWYADELCGVTPTPFSARFSQALAEKNINIIGITNGIDYNAYDPNNTEVSLLPFSFNPRVQDFNGKYACRTSFLQDLLNQNNKFKTAYIEHFGTLEPSDNKLLYIAYHGRIVHQKGINILLETIQKLCARESRFRFLIMGQGTSDFETACAHIAEQNKGKVVFFKGYDKKIARLVSAISDVIVLPSLFEPCGLEDFIAQIYGTIPIAHAIGGLQKIKDGKTGFLFSVHDAEKRFDITALAEVLTEKVLNIGNMFFNSPFPHLLDDKKMSAMIVNANREIEHTYNWTDIICKKYFPLYQF